MESTAALARTAPPLAGSTRRPSCALRPTASLSFAAAATRPRGRLGLGLSTASPGPWGASRARAVLRRKIVASAEVEQSYIMIKPDGVQRGLVGDIISRFEKKGFLLKGLKLFQCPKDLAQEHYKDLKDKPFFPKLIDYIASGPREIISRFEKKGFLLKGLKLFQCPKDLAQEHYKDLKDKPFFPKLIDYITSGPVVCIAWEGDGVVASARKLIGATNPLQAEPGTIRGDLAVQTGRNVVHEVIALITASVKLLYGSKKASSANGNQFKHRGL